MNAWLIELTPGKDIPTYWGRADNENGLIGWTFDVNAALRFCRKEDAETVIEDIGWTESEVKAIEHGWPELNTQPRKEAGEPRKTAADFLRWNPNTPADYGWNARMLGAEGQQNPYYHSYERTNSPATIQWLEGFMEADVVLSQELTTEAGECPQAEGGRQNGG